MIYYFASRVLTLTDTVLSGFDCAINTQRWRLDIAFISHVSAKKFPSKLFLFWNNILKISLRGIKILKSFPYFCPRAICTGTGSSSENKRGKHQYWQRRRKSGARYKSFIGAWQFSCTYENDFKMMFQRISKEHSFDAPTVQF